MSIKKLFIANRGEIAVRISRAASDCGIQSVAGYSQDDAESLHVRACDQAVRLPGQGAAAYLDVAAVVAAAVAAGCDAVHPGYGFLSERADFAQACEDAGLLFVGPSIEHLRLFGDKVAARKAAMAADVPVMRGVNRSVTLDEALAFFDALEPGRGLIIKALAGGGGEARVGSTREVSWARRMNGADQKRPVHSAMPTSSSKSSCRARVTSKSRF